MLVPVFLRDAKGDQVQSHLSSNEGASHTKPGSFSVAKVAAVDAVPRSVARVDWLVPRKPITLLLR